MKTKKLSNLLKSLQSYRLANRISYAKLGEAMGFQKRTVFFWLTGKSKPSQLAEAAIAYYLTARQNPTIIKEKNKCLKKKR